MSSTAFDTDSRAERKGEIGMIDREKVIKGLECCQDCDGCVCRNCCPYHDRNEPEDQPTCTCRLAHDALSLLKEQEPVEPVVDIDTWKCGNCGHTLEHQEMRGINILFHEQYAYCPNCGRAVKWE